MAKLNQLILLENMMKTYDAMNLKDANLTHFQGVCTEKLVDNINGRLERLVVSKVRMSCRNVLLANYETMTKTTYWLGCRLFSDLPRVESQVLREKVEQMVELLNELVLKIVNVDEEFAATFFRKLKEGYGRRKNTKYELWKLQQTEVTMERLTEYQVQITAELLMMGILRYDRAPTDGELEQVQLEKVQRKLSHDKELPEWFRAECAKLRRYSHWEGECFIIDYEKLRKYLFQHFGEMTNEQHIAMFEYDVQMKQIREEMEKVEPTPSPTLVGGEQLPPELSTGTAMVLWKKAQAAGWIDANYQPTISRTQAALLADAMAERLKIENKWKVFETVWKRNNMRSDHTRALSQIQTLSFQDKIKALFVTGT